MHDYLPWKRFKISLVVTSGSLILFIVIFNASNDTESNAFFMSCSTSHSSLLLSFASSIIVLTMCTGSSVEFLGKPAKLGPFRIFFSHNTWASLLVKTFVIHLRKVSSKAIGLTFPKLYCQSPSLDIRYICEIFHFFGILPVRMHISARVQKISCVLALPV